MNRSRWLVVVGALLVQLCLGAIYGWGVFVPALKASRSELVVTLSPELLQMDPAVHAELAAEHARLKRQWATVQADHRAEAQAALDRFLAETVPARVTIDPAVWARQYYGFSGAQAQAVFSTGLLVFAVVMIFAGRWQDRVGPRRVALTGGWVLAAGYGLGAWAGPSFPAVLLSIGVVGGAGIGLAYVCPIAACVKWFPDYKGAITGLAVAGFGGGAFLFIKLAGVWGGWIAAEGVPGTFLVYSLIFAVATTCGALLLRNPPPGWQPGGKPAAAGAPFTSAASTRTVSVWVRDFTQSQIVRTSAFWMLWVAFICASGCGLMVIGSLKDFGIREGGLTTAEAEGALSLLAVFNALGRIVWGSVSQRLGGRKTLALVSLLQAGMVLALVEMGSQVWTLEIAACWVGFQFGGNLALFPLLTAEFFGTRHLGANYGLVFTAYGIGGVLGPMLAGGVWDWVGSYQWAFWPAAGGCLLTLLLALVVEPPEATESAASAAKA